MQPKKQGASKLSEAPTIKKCADCGNEFDAESTLKIRAFLGPTQPLRCPSCRGKHIACEEEKDAREHQQRLAGQKSVWLHNSGIPPRFRAKGFEDFQPHGNEARVRIFREYAEAFPMKGRPEGALSLLIVSRENGVGKTHLSCALLRRIIDRFDRLGQERCPYRFVTAGQVKRRVQDAHRFQNPESVSDVYRDFASAWLLVIDDIGKEKLTDADRAVMYEVYYQIINDRYNAELPLIITSNLGLEPWDPEGISLKDLIGEPACSRLAEMTESRQYGMVGEDRRYRLADGP